MAFKSLLLSKDGELVLTLTRLLKELDITVEPCSEPFAAAKRLMDQHFDAILVDCEDEQGAGWVLQSARMATASKKSVTIAIVGAQSARNGGPRAGENFVIQKPVVLKQVESTLRAARGLMGDGAVSTPSSAPEPAISVAADTAAKPAAAAPAPAFSAGQGRPPAEMFDELTAALDRLGPQSAPMKAVPVASSATGSAAAAAPAWEKPVPAAPQPAPPRPEPLAQPVLRPAQQSWPGLSAAPEAPPTKVEVSPVLPLAATAAEMKPARPSQDQARSNSSLDDVRRRMNAAPPPAWRTDAEERREAPPPRFSSFANDEEPRKGFPFKTVAVVMVLVSFALFGYSWYREHKASETHSEQEQAPVVSQPQAVSESPSSQATAAAPSGGESERASAEAALPETSSTQLVKENRKAAAPLKGGAENTAPDTTTDLGLPPAPLVVEGGHGHAGAVQHGENPIAPPSLNAVADGSKPGLGGMVNAAPVKVPKLAAAPEPTPVPTRVRVSQGVTQGLLVRKVNPQYPAMARDSRLEGDVVLEAVIGTDGSVRDLRVVSGPALLVGPAMQAVRQWRYKPYLLNGQPVEVETQIKLQFRL